MTRATTAIMMIFWLLCQQAVAGVVAYKMFPSMPTEHAKSSATHCQESLETGDVSVHHGMMNDSVLGANGETPVHSHGSTDDCCDRDCQCCVGSCTTHLVMSEHALHCKNMTHSPTLDFRIATPIPSIQSLFRPPILS